MFYLFRSNFTPGDSIFDWDEKSFAVVLELNLKRERFSHEIWSLQTLLGFKWGFCRLGRMNWVEGDWKILEFEKVNKFGCLVRILANPGVQLILFILKKKY